ncbi:ACN9-domain-containing protein [Cytidiella melzeri]|nr:ACN9-domain-containing protein [Cytidiella melzeri]
MLRTTAVRLAESVSKAPLTLQQAGASLLPPIPLYRALLRAHRRLSIDMRSLGDDYVKAEFRRHRTIDNPLHIIGFLSQWKLYLDDLPADPTQEFRGRKLDSAVLEKMSAEQVGQLYELMHATKNVWKPITELQHDADAAERMNNS